jgi:glycosyltransferase involved in cell wall biosynthesis
MNAIARDRVRILGLLPPLGGSLTSLQATGQVSRLLEQYLPAYLERFDRVVFFSSRRETLAEFTGDRDLIGRTTLVDPPLGWDGRRAGLARLALRRKELQRCSVLRALQAPGALPALASTTPLVVTYGYSYAEVSRYVGRRRSVELVRQFALGTVLKAVLRKAQLTVLTNPALVEEARRLGARDLVVIPNGVPVDLFRPESGTPAPTYDVVLLGRLTPEKNHALLARAAKRLERGLRVCVVGDGPLRRELEQEFARSACAAHFLGMRPYADLPAILRSASVFVLPSSTEGRTKALLEAMACGLPCVVSDLPAFADIIRAGAVRAFPSGDADALARVLRELLSDPSGGSEQGRAGRKYAERTANLKVALDEEARMLRQVADAAGGR